MKKKKILPLLLGICLVSTLGLSLTTRVSAASYTTKAECASNVLTINATAPSSVTASAAFEITNVSSSSTAPGGITVNKIVSTSSASNASPSVVTGTWTGTGTGSFTATFPNTSLTASGAVGSQVTMRLSSVDLYVNGLTNPITCSLANGQLTANNPGQSLTVFSIPITAPAASAPATTTTPKTSSNSSQTNKTTPAAPAPAATTPTSQEPASTTNNTQASTQSQPQLVAITIVDSSGNPMSDVSVSVDGNTPVKTNSRGVAIFENLSTGKHKVAVLGAKSEITREIDVSGGSEPVELTVELPHQLISPKLMVILGAVAVVVLLASGIGYVLYRRGKAKSLAQHIAPGVTPTTPVAHAVSNSVPASVEPTPIQSSSLPAATGPLPVEPSTPIQTTQPLEHNQPFANQPVATVQPISPASPSTPVTPQPTPTSEPVPVIPQPTPQPIAPIQPTEHIAPSVPHQPGQMIIPQTQTHFEPHA